MIPIFMPLLNSCRISTFYNANMPHVEIRTKSIRDHKNLEYWDGTSKMLTPKMV